MHTREHIAWTHLSALDGIVFVSYTILQQTHRQQCRCTKSCTKLFNFHNIQKQQFPMSCSQWWYFHNTFTQSYSLSSPKPNESTPKKKRTATAIQATGLRLACLYAEQKSNGKEQSYAMFRPHTKPLPPNFQSSIWVVCACPFCWEFLANSRHHIQRGLKPKWGIRGSETIDT